MLLTVVMWKHPSQYYQPACFPLSRSDQGSTETSFVRYRLLLFAQPVKVRGAHNFSFFLVAFESFWIADLESVYRLMLASLGTKDLSWSSTTFCNATLIATISAQYIDVVEPAGASTKCSSWLWLSMMSAPAPSSQHSLNTDTSVYISIAAGPSLLIVSSTTSRLNSALSSLCTH